MSVYNVCCSHTQKNPHHLNALVHWREECDAGMKVIRHAGVESRMIILDDQTRQQMTLRFQLSLQCNVSPITGFVRQTAKKKEKSGNLYTSPMGNDWSG